MFPPGARVQVIWTDGRTHGATVRWFNGSVYEIAWDAGGIGHVPPHAIAPAPAWGPAPNAPWGGAPAAPPAPSFAGWSGPLAPGTRVSALWRGGGRYPATVRDFDSARYAVEWDDGTGIEWVAAAEVHPDPTLGPPPVRRAVVASSGEGPFVDDAHDLATGMEVVALTKTGLYRKGTIVTERGSVLEVKLSDHERTWVHRTQLRSRADAGAPPLPRYTKVMGRWWDGRSYAAEVADAKEGACRVRWQDGAGEVWLTPRNVQGGQSAGDVLFDFAAGALFDALVDRKTGQTASSWSVGAPCLASWGGKAYGAIVIKYLSADRYEVELDDSGVRSKLGLDEIFKR